MGERGQAGGATTLSASDSLLVEACKKGNIEKLREALEAQANPNVQFKQTLEDTTPLMLVSTRGHAELAELLIEKGAEVNAKMGFGHATPLLQAVSNEHNTVAALLLKHKANPNCFDKLGRTALMDASENGNVELVRLLINHGADVDMQDSQGRTALSYCLDFVSKDDDKYYGLAKTLVFDYSSDYNAKGRTTNRTLLHCAAARGDLELVKKLVEEKQCEVNVVDTMGYSAITYATKAQHQDIAQYLHERSQGACCCIL